MSACSFLPLLLENHSVVVVPGLSGSGVTHWQTFWELAHSGWMRAEQDDWNHPVRDAWVRRLTETVNAANRPVILVAHSMGCATIAHAAHERRLGNVVAAFLVAMPDVEREDFPRATCEGYDPLPPTSLPFPSLFVGSSNDPWISLERQEHLARLFGSRFVNVGERHHIGTAAELGAWSEGFDLFADFLRGLGLLDR